MKRPKSSRPRHAKPPQASTTRTACIIISFWIAAMAIGLLLLICYSGKLSGGKVSHPHVAAPSPASPLGGAPDKVPKANGKTAVVTTLPTEPLEGGGGSMETEQHCNKSADTAVTAPQQRDRPAIEAMQAEVVEAQEARERRIAVWRINTWFAQRGGPMQGLGECFILNQERTGIPASLVAGIAEAESSNGMQCYNNPPGGCSYNAYGMIGPEYRGGFSGWQEGVAANFDYLVKHFGCPQTMHDAPGYCEGDTTMATVDWAQGVINTYEVPF